MAEKRKVYDLWMKYDNFIRSLHLETLEKQLKYSRRKRFFNYLKRLPIIFFASFLTTLTFQFFINPNKLFNSGLNGIIQVVTNYFFTRSGVSERNRAIGYYAIVLLTNTFIVSIIQFFYPYNFEVNSTAIFYVLFQFIWSSIFRYYSLNSYFFSRFSARSWSNLSSLNQLGLTLPFYITIGVVSAIIHTYGYSLIYQAKSTPGGFEILTSAFAQNSKKKGKKRVSAGSLSKLLGIFVIFFVTSFNFFVVNDNLQLKKNGLIDLINSNILNTRDDRKIGNEDDLTSFLHELNKEDYSSAGRKFLVDWSGDHSFDKLPKGIHTYLNNDKQILKELCEVEKKKESTVQTLLTILENNRNVKLPTSKDPNFSSDHSSLEVVASASSLGEVSEDNYFLGDDVDFNAFYQSLVDRFSSSEKCLSNFLKELIEKERTFLFHIRVRIEEVRRNTYEKSFLGYFKYITNDEKLWASLIYIFFSSYLLNQIFPKSKSVLLTAFLGNNNDLTRMLTILQEYKPSYLRVLPRGEEEEEKYLLFCSITKWNYQLLANEINKFGKVLISVLDESN